MTQFSKIQAEIAGSEQEQVTSAMHSDRFSQKVSYI